MSHLTCLRSLFRFECSFIDSDAGNANIVLGERIAEVVSGFGVVRSKNCIITNWANGEVITPVARENNPLRGTWRLGDRFIIGYSGNFGRVHELDTVLSAIDIVARSDDACSRNIAWLFVGSGALYDRLRYEVGARSMSNVMVQPYQTRDRLGESFAVPIIHLDSLRRAFEWLVLPSKFYGVLASDRACIFVGDLKGEIARVIKRTETGFIVPKGDGVVLA